MRSIVGPLRSRYVEPASYRAFDGFTCGGRAKPEREIDKLVADFHAGRKSQCEMRVTEDTAAGALVGLCCFRRVVLGRNVLPRANWDALYVAAIGLGEPYRRCRLLADGSRMGDVVLTDALHEFDRRWGVERMPAIVALVSPSNDASLRLFRRHGFEEFIPAVGTGDAWFRRPLGLEVP
jgi:ribosomal protein S18 acetylase RimI-like enzyme